MFECYNENIMLLGYVNNRGMYWGMYNDKICILSFYRKIETHCKQDEIIFLVIESGR